MSEVPLYILKSEPEDPPKVRLMRMRTQEIADRRRLFELFTWLLDNNKALKEPEVRSRDGPIIALFGTTLW